MTKRIIAITLTLISIFTVFAFTSCSNVESKPEEGLEKVDNVETITFEATVHKLDLETYHVDGIGTRTKYYASVKSDDFIKVVEITEEQYVLLNIGDIVIVNIENSKLNGRRITIELS